MKPDVITHIGDTYQVAPFAGAWIETALRVIGGNVLTTVAPFAGAWIETVMLPYPCLESEKSLPSRERGLKLILGVKYINAKEVAPFAGAWIETTSL